MAKALKFKGEGYQPEGFIESCYGSDSGDYCFSMAKEVSSFGSRESGKIAYNTISRVLETCEAKLILDFAGVAIISSSFADEVFGRLFLKLDPMNFMKKIQITKASSTITGIIDRAISKRFAGSEKNGS